MKNKYAIVLSYIFIILCSVFLMNFQTATVNQLHLGQNFEDGFVDENGYKAEVTTYEDGTVEETPKEQ